MGRHGNRGHGSFFWFIVLVFLFFAFLFSSTDYTLILESFFIWLNQDFGSWFSDPNTIIGLFVLMLVFGIFLMMFIPGRNLTGRRR